MSLIACRLRRQVAHDATATPHTPLDAIVTYASATIATPRQRHVTRYAIYTYYAITLLRVATLRWH